MDPFLLETIKNPFSAPFLMMLQLILTAFVILKLNFKVIIDYKNKLSKLPPKEKYCNLAILFVSLILFLSSTFLIFYKMTDVPSGAFEADEGALVVAAYYLKNLGHDSLEKKVPYYPYIDVNHHHERFTGFGQRGVPVYFQAFTQYFVPPGFFSLRLECTVLMFITSIFLIYLLYLITGDIVPSILGGALFNVLPWTRVLARVGPEATTYCFASACFLFSFLYFLNSKKLHAIVFYLVSLAILYLSYPPGLLLAPLCGLLLPMIAARHSETDSAISKRIILIGLIFLGLLFFDFHNDGGFKESLSRAQNAQGLVGIANFDLSALLNTFISRAKIYTGNYLGYLFPQFLFLTGDPNTRHNTGFGGQLFVSLCIAFYLGLFYLFEKRRESLPLKIILSYLLIAVIPAAVTIEGGLEIVTKLPLHGLRSSCILPPITIILVLGLIEIFKKKRIIVFLYLVIVTVNAYLFYVDYFTKYPQRLGRAFDDAGLKDVSEKALLIIKKHPDKKLFFSAPFISIEFHNLDRIGIKALVNGGGLLSNVYHFESRGNVEPQKGDLVLAHEPWNYGTFNKKFQYILRVPNTSLGQGAFGASLFEITE